MKSINLSDWIDVTVTASIAVDLAADVIDAAQCNASGMRFGVDYDNASADLQAYAAQYGLDAAAVLAVVKSMIRHNAFCSFGLRTDAPQAAAFLRACSAL